MFTIFNNSTVILKDSPFGLLSLIIQFSLLFISSELLVDNLSDKMQSLSLFSSPFLFSIKFKSSLFSLISLFFVIYIKDLSLELNLNELFNAVNLKLYGSKNNSYSLIFLL